MRRQFRRFAPFLVFGAGLVLVLLVTLGLSRIAREADRERFLSLVDDRQSRISRQIDRHLALLNGTLALFYAHPRPVDYAAFRRYVEGLDINKRFDGILGLGYAMRVTAEDLPAAERLLSDLYGPQAKIWPRLDGLGGFPVIYLRPEDEVNAGRIGFDLASDPVRRQALERARDTGEPSATAPIELGEETGEEAGLGFLIVLAHYDTRTPASDLDSRRQAVRGFVYAQFKASDFFSAALFPSARSPVQITVYDQATGPGRPLFNSHLRSTPGETLRERRVMSVAGRQWMLEFAAGEGHRSTLPSALLAAFVIVGLLLSGAAAGVVHFQVQALDHAVRDAEAAKRAQAEKEMLLQEMRHRIKNSLARVAAISRQSARSAKNLDEFVTSFDARIRAMDRSQDLLTRSRWEKAPLDELLRAELIPVLGEEEGRFELTGPDLVVGARQALALGLTFHELATNALKHGGLAEETAKLKVSWSVAGSGPERVLRIDWQERGSPASNGSRKDSGFGSKLIEMSIVGELEGAIERDFGEDGFSAVLTIPLREKDKNDPA